MSFLEQLITLFNKEGIECHLEKDRLKGSKEDILFISITVKTEDSTGEIKLRLDKFASNFGKMMLMNGKTLQESIIILKKLCESGMIRLMNEVIIDKTKVIE